MAIREGGGGLGGILMKFVYKITKKVDFDTHTAGHPP